MLILLLLGTAKWFQSLWQMLPTEQLEKKKIAKGATKARHK